MNLSRLSKASPSGACGLPPHAALHPVWMSYLLLRCRLQTLCVRLNWAGSCGPTVTTDAYVHRRTVAGGRRFDSRKAVKDGERIHTIGRCVWPLGALSAVMAPLAGCDSVQVHDGSGRTQSVGDWPGGLNDSVESTSPRESSCSPARAGHSSGIEPRSPLVRRGCACKPASPVCCLGSRGRALRSTNRATPSTGHCQVCPCLAP